MARYPIGSFSTRWGITRYERKAVHAKGYIDKGVDVVGGIPHFE